MCYNDIESLGECSEMEKGVNNLNETAVALIRRAFDTASLEANIGEYAWVIEVYNSMQFSTCTRLMLPHSHEHDETFQCSLRVINLCFIDGNYKTEEPMQAA